MIEGRLPGSLIWQGPPEIISSLRLQTDSIKSSPRKQTSLSAALKAVQGAQVHNLSWLLDPGGMLNGRARVSLWAFIILTLRPLIGNSWKEVGVGQYEKAARRGKYSYALKGQGLGQWVTLRCGKERAKAGRKRTGTGDKWGRHSGQRMKWWVREAEGAGKLREGIEKRKKKIIPPTFLPPKHCCSWSKAKHLHPATRSLLHQDGHLKVQSIPRVKESDSVDSDRPRSSPVLNNIGSWSGLLFSYGLAKN